jgi:hypothetical protein
MYTVLYRFHISKASDRMAFELSPFQPFELSVMLGSFVLSFFFARRDQE